MPAALEIRAVSRDIELSLVRFFAALREHGIDKFFHPHPFTVEAAHERAIYAGRDLYYVMHQDLEILGYGMLRGWDEGYEIPSLGIVVHPGFQGRGLGRLLMDFLRAAALQRGARRIRLRVHPDNETALQLYCSLGYQFSPEADGPYRIGFLDLPQPSVAAS